MIIEPNRGRVDRHEAVRSPTERRRRVASRCATFHPDEARARRADLTAVQDLREER